MGDAGQRLRARRARRLVTRFAVAGGVLVLGAGGGWAMGLPAPATMATLCIGLPVAALIHHFVTQEHGRRRRNGQMPWHPIRRRHHPGVTLARSREP